MKKTIIWTVIFIILGVWIFGKVAPTTRNNLKNELVRKVFGVTPDTVKNYKLDKKVLIIRKKTIIKTPKREEIPIEVGNGEIHIIAEINGIKVNFLLDSGCSGIQLSGSDFGYLMHMKAMSGKDATSPGIATLADGSKSECQGYNIKNLKFGKTVLKNMECSVPSNSTTDTESLLGHSVLEKLGKVTIDYKNQKLIIN